MPQMILCSIIDKFFKNIWSDKIPLGKSYEITYFYPKSFEKIEVEMAMLQFPAKPIFI